MFIAKEQIIQIVSQWIWDRFPRAHLTNATLAGEPGKSNTINGFEITMTCNRRASEKRRMNLNWVEYYDTYLLYHAKKSIQE